MKIKNVLLIVMLVSIGLLSSNVSPAQAPGDLDFTFGPSNTGEVILVPPLGNAPNHYESVLQSDGKIVSLLGENDGSNPTANMLVRLNADGSVDTSFGTAGYVYMTIGGAGNGKFYTLGKQSISGEERLVVAGWSACGRKTCLRAERYTSAGTLDLTFGNSGVTTVSAATPNRSAIQQDQKILLVSNSGTVVRLLQNGGVDNTFGTSGIATAAGIGVLGIKTAADGRILLSGRRPRGKSGDLAVARLNTNGSIDDGGSQDSSPGDSFGTLGVASVDFNGNNEEAYSLAIDGAGRIVLAGQAQIGGSVIANYDAVLAGFSPSGTLDTSFGSLGKVTLNVGGRQDLFKAIALQPDGAILVTGEGRAVGRDADALTARYLRNGILDSGFGNGGYVLNTLFSNYDQAQSILIQSDPYCGGCTKLIVAGTTSNQISFVLRYWH